MPEYSVAASVSLTITSSPNELGEIGVAVTTSLTVSPSASISWLETADTDYGSNPSSSVMYMFYPWDVPTLEILLGRPEFGDIVELNPQIQLLHARDGSRWSYKDTPVRKILHYDFVNLTRRKIMEIQNFFQQSKGQTIRMIDYEGVAWKGTVGSSPVPFNTSGSGTISEVGTFSFAFEGEEL